MSDNDLVSKVQNPDSQPSENADLGSSSFGGTFSAAVKPSGDRDLKLVSPEQETDLVKARMPGVLGTPSERDSQLTEPAANFFHGVLDSRVKHVTPTDMSHAAMAGLEVARLAMEHMNQRVAASSADVIEAWQKHKGEAQPAEPGALALAKVREMRDGVLARIGEMAAGNDGPVDNVNLLSPGQLSGAAVKEAAAGYLERAA